MSYTDVRPVATTNVSYTPVTFESAAGLTGCTLTDGRGLLMWRNGLNIRYAILASPTDWLANSVVTSGMTSTAFTSTGYVVGGAACYMVGGFPHFTVHDASATVGRVMIYKGNSGSNPTSWSLHGTVQSSTDDRIDGAHPTFIEGQLCAGIPYVVGSTWTLGTPVWGPGGAVNTAWCYAGMYQSTDGGVSWSMKLQRGYGTASRFMNFCSPHVAKDPDTGYLYWMAGSYTAGSATTTSEWCKSTDGGVTWVIDQNVGPSNFSTPYTDRAGNLYALRGHVSGCTTAIHNDPDGSFADLTTSATHLAVNLGAHLCLGGDTLYLFGENTVQWAVNSEGGWHVGLHALRIA